MISVSGRTCVSTTCFVTYNHLLPARPLKHFCMDYIYVSIYIHISCVKLQPYKISPGIVLHELYCTSKAGCGLGSRLPINHRVGGLILACPHVKVTLNITLNTKVLLMHAVVCANGKAGSVLR